MDEKEEITVRQRKDDLIAKLYLKFRGTIVSTLDEVTEFVDKLDEKGLNIVEHLLGSPNISSDIFGIWKPGCKNLF